MSVFKSLAIKSFHIVKCTFWANEYMHFRGDPQKTMRRGLHLNGTSSLLIVYEMAVEQDFVIIIIIFLFTVRTVVGATENFAYE